MPSIRVGFSSDLNITGGNTGIGTATPTARLEVSNGIVAERAAGGGGISTFKEYQGFSQTLATLPHEIATEEGVFSSLTGEIKITGETTVSSGSTVEVGKTKTLTVTDRFAVPLGETNNRDNAPEAGTTRFNQDFGTLEFFDGANWKTVNSYARYHGGAAGRAVFGGGYYVSGTNNGNMEFINIMSLGNGVNFGDMVLSAKYSQSGCSDGKRGLFVGGQSVSDIEYITIASAGDSIDFGNLTGSNGNHCGSLSSSTRGIRGGGYSAPAGIDVIDYVEIQTLGNALDFGDLLEGNYGLCGFSSPTRGIFAGGRGADAPLGQTTINVITISSKGNATRFGDVSARHSYVAGFSNSVRGFITGGNNPRTDTIQYVTIASEGNAQDFGNLTVAKEGICSGNSANQVRGICAGGVESTPAGTKVIEYITIASQGNAQDFGDMSSQRGYAGALSDSHGGLGGF